jgi:cysteine desulfurase
MGQKDREKMQVYLDNSATTRPYEQVTLEMARAMQEDYGNPSSLHSMGIVSEKQIRTARRAIAMQLGVQSEEIFFTGSGTEADNMAIFGLASAQKRRGNKIITSRVEHPAVLESCKSLGTMGFEIAYIGVDVYGKIDLDQLEYELNDQTILISIMHVNNELGTIQPIAEIGKLKKKYEGVYFHTDAVQSFGKLSLDPQKCGIDLLSVSAHKLHGPKGIGALYINRGTRIAPLIQGGGQEQGLRSGTENVPAIIGFGIAAERAASGQTTKMKDIARLRDCLLSGIQANIKDCRINSPEAFGSSPTILNVSFAGTRGEVLLHMLEQSGIYVSTASACSSNKRGRSHVLQAVGLTEQEIEGAIRFSFSEMNTMTEMVYTLERLEKAVADMRRTLSR